MTGPLVVTADQAAELCGYGDGSVIRSFYRRGRFPAPIDPTLPARQWRWSRTVIDQYVNGQWENTV